MTGIVLSKHVASEGVITCHLLPHAISCSPGPWLVGEVITGKTGVVFAWGTFVGGAFIPGLLQYAFGLLQLLLFHLPLLVATAVILDGR